MRAPAHDVRIWVLTYGHSSRPSTRTENPCRGAVPEESFNNITERGGPAGVVTGTIGDSDGEGTGGDVVGDGGGGDGGLLLARTGGEGYGGREGVGDASSFSSSFSSFFRSDSRPQIPSLLLKVLSYTSVILSPFYLSYHLLPLPRYHYPTPFPVPHPLPLLSPQQAGCSSLLLFYSILFPTILYIARKMKDG